VSDFAALFADFLTLCQNKAVFAIGDEIGGMCAFPGSACKSTPPPRKTSVPGGSLPLVVGVLVTIGVPGEAIAIILGIDRLLDMCRTTLNVTGDLVCAVLVARGEGNRSPDGSVIDDESADQARPAMRLADKTGQEA
jgi:hypothetical protein